MALNWVGDHENHPKTKVKRGGNQSLPNGKFCEETTSNPESAESGRSKCMGKYTPSCRRGH